MVCTAGITEKNEWVRLYPIDYRYRPKQQQFRKYQWIEVSLSPRGSGSDKRKESRKPDLESIKLLGEPLSTCNAWEARRAVIDGMPHNTVNELISLYDRDNTSLGIVRPQEIISLEIEDADPDWRPEWEMIYKQMTLFDPPKPLRKILFKFSYTFKCHDNPQPQKAMITDWELGVLFLKESERLKSEDKAAESVRKKYLHELCARDRDTRFFMGTVLPYNTWIVLGVFWPPKTRQASMRF
ncbi:MAG: hypothetical protein AB1742_06370 [bacterium]